MALSKEENDMYTQVGPGKPAGELLRRHDDGVGAEPAERAAIAAGSHAGDLLARRGDPWRIHGRRARGEAL